MATQLDDDTENRSGNRYRDGQPAQPGSPKQQQMDEKYGGKKSYLSDETKEKIKDYAAKKGTHAALGAAEAGLFGDKIRPLAGLAKEELRDAEAKGFNSRNLYDPNWYKEAAPAAGKKVAKKGFKALTKKWKAAIYATILVNLFVVIVLLALFFIAPFKHIHFETILRSANFARFQLVVRKQFTAVIFNAGVLTRDSVGNFRNSPLVRQIRLAIPDRQLAQLGRQGRIQFDFHPNSSWGNEVAPLRETLRAIVIDGQRFDIDQFARDFSNGRNYSQLSTRERYTVQNRFVRAVNVKMGDLMSLMPRHVRWNPMVRLHQRTGIRLVKWLNAYRDARGATVAEARARTAEDTSRRVMDPSQRTATSAIPEINEAADEARQEAARAATEGRAPVPNRTRIANATRGVRGVSDAVFATTVYCIGRELYNAFSSPEAQQDRESQAMRMAANDMTTSDQLKVHPPPTPFVSATNQQWDAMGETPDASRSVVYKQITEQPVPQTPAYQKQQIPWLDPSRVFGEWADEFDALGKGIDSPLSGLASLIGFDLNLGQKEVNDKVCQAMLNQYVQYGVAIGEIGFAIFSLGSSKGITAAVKGALELTFHFAIGLGLGELLNLLLEWVVKEYARLYFTGLEQGADRVNTGYVAQNALAQNSNRNVTYARPGDQAETNVAQQVAMDALRAEHQSQGFQHRYFAIDNPFSLLGLTVAKIPVSGGGLAATIQNGTHFMGAILSSPSRLISSIGNALMPPKLASAKSLASSTVNFGVDQWIWSMDELERIETDPSFSVMAQTGDSPLLSYVEPRITELNDRYAKCYNPDSFVLQSDQPKEGSNPICTREFLSTDDALHWRYYKSLEFGAQHLTGSI